MNAGSHSPIAYRISGQFSAVLVMDTGASAPDSNINGKGDDEVNVVVSIRMVLDMVGRMKRTGKELEQTFCTIKR